MGEPNGELLEPIRKPRKGERAALIRRMHLDYPELSNRQIAKQVGCNSKNVDQVLSRFLGKHKLSDLRDYQQNQADIFDAVSYRSLASITEESLSKANPLQLGTLAAIMVDKSRLVRGQATSINVSAVLNLIEVIRDQDE